MTRNSQPDTTRQQADFGLTTEYALSPKKSDHLNIFAITTANPKRVK